MRIPTVSAYGIYLLGRVAIGVLAEEDVAKINLGSPDYCGDYTPGDVTLSLERGVAVFVGEKWHFMGEGETEKFVTLCKSNEGEQSFRVLITDQPHIPVLNDGAGQVSSATYEIAKSAEDHLLMGVARNDPVLSIPPGIEVKRKIINVQAQINLAPPNVLTWGAPDKAPVRKSSARWLAQELGQESLSSFSIWSYPEGKGDEDSWYSLFPLSKRNCVYALPLSNFTRTYVDITSDLPTVKEGDKVIVGKETDKEHSPMMCTSKPPANLKCPDDVKTNKIELWLGERHHLRSTNRQEDGKSVNVDVWSQDKARHALTAPCGQNIEYTVVWFPPEIKMPKDDKWDKALDEKADRRVKCTYQGYGSTPLPGVGLKRGVIPMMLKPGTNSGDYLSLAPTEWLNCEELELSKSAVRAISAA